MLLTDYEALVRIRRSWSEFLDKAAEPEPYAGAGRVVFTSRREVPACDAIALREGQLVIAARREHDESLIRQNLKSRDPSRLGRGIWSRHRQILARRQPPRGGHGPG